MIKHPEKFDETKWDYPWSYARKILHNNPIRRGIWQDKYEIFQIFFKGKWLDIYATTLIDDVGTVHKIEYFSQEEQKDPHKLAARDHYGVRISDTGFGLIMTVSDG